MNPWHSAMIVLSACLSVCVAQDPVGAAYFVGMAAPPGAGSFEFSSMGVPYDGGHIFFENVDLEVRAVPVPGYRFSHWDSGYAGNVRRFYSTNEWRVWPAKQVRWTAYFVPVTLGQRDIGSPYGGTPAKIPGIIEGEHFDAGGEQVAYHASQDRNQLVSSKSGWGKLDLLTFHSSRNANENVAHYENRFLGRTAVGIARGSWLQYTVQNESDGLFEMAITTSSGDRLYMGRDSRGCPEYQDVAGGGSVSIQVDEGLMERSGSGSGTITVSSVWVPRGIHRVRIHADGAGDVLILDSIQFRPMEPPRRPRLISGGATNFLDGVGSRSGLGRLTLLDEDAESNLLFYDSTYHAIRRIGRNGLAETVVGAGKPGTNDGYGRFASLGEVWQIAWSPTGGGVFTEVRSNRTVALRRIGLDWRVTTLSEDLRTNTPVPPDRSGMIPVETIGDLQIGRQGRIWFTVTSDKEYEVGGGFPFPKWSGVNLERFVYFFEWTPDAGAKLVETKYESQLLSQDVWGGPDPCSRGFSYRRPSFPSRCFGADVNCSSPPAEGVGSLLPIISGSSNKADASGSDPIWTNDALDGWPGQFMTRDGRYIVVAMTNFRDQGPSSTLWELEPTDPVSVAVVGPEGRDLPSGFVSGSLFVRNEPVLLTGRDIDGMKFLGWGGDVQSTNAQVVFTPRSNSVVHALFGIPLHFVGSNVVVSVLPNRPYHRIGSEVTVEVAPVEPFVHVKWSDGYVGGIRKLRVTLDQRPLAVIGYGVVDDIRQLAVDLRKGSDNHSGSILTVMNPGGKPFRILESEDGIRWLDMGFTRRGLSAEVPIRIGTDTPTRFFRALPVP